MNEKDQREHATCVCVCVCVCVLLQLEITVSNGVAKWAENF